MVGSTGFVHWFTTNPYEDREMDGYTSLVIDMLKDSNFESELTDWTSLSLSSFGRVNEMSTVDVISEWNPRLATGASGDPLRGTYKRREERLFCARMLLGILGFDQIRTY